MTPEEREQALDRILRENREAIHAMRRIQIANEKPLGFQRRDEALARAQRANQAAIDLLNRWNA